MAFYKLGTREGGVNPTGNAVEANVLKDKTFSNASGINKIGTMPDNSTTTSNGTVPGINSSYPNIPIRPGSNLQMGVNTDGVKQLALEPPQGYYPGGGSSYIGVDADDLGDAVASDVVSGKTFTSESGIEVVGTMPNNGAVSPSALSPNGSYTIPEGYHNGNGVVTASPNTGTYSPTTRNVALDMGISNLNRYVNTTGVPNSNTETYTASSRGASLDMGATNSYRYVNTNGVPNSNSGTYTFASGDTGGTKDLGVTNTYRYVNATNVYNKGINDASVSGLPSAGKGIWRSYVNNSYTNHINETITRTSTISNCYMWGIFNISGLGITKIVANPQGSSTGSAEVCMLPVYNDGTIPAGGIMSGSRSITVSSNVIYIIINVRIYTYNLIFS